MQIFQIRIIKNAKSTTQKLGNTMSRIDVLD